MAKSKWYDDYEGIAEIELEDKLNDVIELCLDGLNLLWINTPDTLNYNYTIALFKGEQIEVWGFKDEHIYGFKEKIFFNEKAIIADLINEIYNIIANSKNIVVYK